MKYAIISLCIAVAVSFVLYNVTQNLDKTISTQKELIESQKAKIKELNAQIVFEKKNLEEQADKLKEYESRVQEVKTVTKPVVVYREIVKTLPKEVIVETANEDTNETITSIVNSANSFVGMYNN
jgi:division protein CdvB (Snf7/Vps24/ESCRT-III family)